MVGHSNFNAILWLREIVRNLVLCFNLMLARIKNNSRSNEHIKKFWIAIWWYSEIVKNRVLCMKLNSKSTIIKIIWFNVQQYKTTFDLPNRSKRTPSCSCSLPSASTARSSTRFTRSWRRRCRRPTRISSSARSTEPPTTFPTCSHRSTASRLFSSSRLTG